MQRIGRGRKLSLEFDEVVREPRFGLRIICSGLVKAPGALILGVLRASRGFSKGQGIWNTPGPLERATETEKGGKKVHCPVGDSVLVQASLAGERRR
jgi:hypothetical protein